MKSFLIPGGSLETGLHSARLLLHKRQNIYSSYNSALPRDQHPNIHYNKYNVWDDDNGFNNLPEKPGGSVHCPGAIYVNPYQ